MAQDLTGQTFGRLTVIGHPIRGPRRKWRWWCRCECGTEKYILGEDLTRGTTRSCGCLRAEGRASGPAPELDSDLKRECDLAMMRDRATLWRRHRQRELRRAQP